MTDGIRIEWRGVDSRGVGRTGDSKGQPEWSVRAERLLERALDETRRGVDSIPTVTAALEALRIEAGEVAADVMDGYPFPDEDWDDGRPCTCPADLVARGGWTSRCPAHGGLHAC